MQKTLSDLREKFEGITWNNDEYRQELLIAAEGTCIVAELQAMIQGVSIERVTDTEAWLLKFSEKWLQKNKPSELHELEKFFRECEKYISTI